MMQSMFACDIPVKGDALIWISLCRDYQRTFESGSRCAVTFHNGPDVTASWLNWCFLMFACDIPENNDAVICISHCRDYKRTFEVVRKCADTFHKWILT